MDAWRRFGVGFLFSLVYLGLLAFGSRLLVGPSPVAGWQLYPRGAADVRDHPCRPTRLAWMETNMCASHVSSCLFDRSACPPARAEAFSRRCVSRIVRALREVRALLQRRFQEVSDWSLRVWLAAFPALEKQTALVWVDTGIDAGSTWTNEDWRPWRRGSFGLRITAVMLVFVLVVSAVSFLHDAAMRTARAGLDYNKANTDPGDCFRAEMLPAARTLAVLCFIPLLGQAVASAVAAWLVLCVLMSWVAQLFMDPASKLYRKLKTFETLEVTSGRNSGGASGRYEMSLPASPIRELRAMPTFVVEFLGSESAGRPIGLGTVFKEGGKFYLVTAAHVLAAWGRTGEFGRLSGPKGCISRAKARTLITEALYSPMRQLDVVVFNLPEAVRQHLGVKPCVLAKRVYKSQSVEAVGCVPKDGRFVPAFSNGALGNRMATPYHVSHYASTLPGWSGGPVLTGGAKLLGVHLGCCASEDSNRMLAVTELSKVFLNRAETSASERDFWKANFGADVDEEDHLWEEMSDRIYDIRGEFADWELLTGDSSELRVRRARRSRSGADPWDEDVDLTWDGLEADHPGTLNEEGPSPRSGGALPRTTSGVNSRKQSTEAELGGLESVLGSVRLIQNQATLPESPSFMSSAPTPRSTAGPPGGGKVKGEASSSKPDGSIPKSKEASVLSLQSTASKSLTSSNAGTLVHASLATGNSGCQETMPLYVAELVNFFETTLSEHLPPDSHTLRTVLQQMVTSLSRKNRQWLISSCSALKDTGSLPEPKVSA